MASTQTNTNLANTNSENTPVHVLHIASGDLWAGAEVMLYTLTKALHAEPGARVTVILLNPGTLEQKLRDCGVNVHVLDESRFNGLQILKQLNEIIRDIKPDVIHTHRIKENIIGSIVAWRNRIPSIRTTHGASEHRPPLYKLPKHIILLLDRLTGRYSQRFVVAVSPDLAKKLESDFPRTKIKMIENGIDIELLTSSSPLDKTKTANTTSFNIGIAGRLVPVKRVDLFIQVAVCLKQQHPELSINFHIFGDGPLHAPLKTQTQTQQAENYIHFEGHCDNIPQALQKLDALLMTSDHEGLPMVLLEAMCLRTPIIAHAVGGIPNLLDHGKCGTLVYEHTAQAFADAIFELTDKPEQYHLIADRAYHRIERHYSATQTARSYLDVYREITNIRAST